PGENPPPVKKTFENEFGYSWWKEPQDISESVATRPNTVGLWTLTLTQGGGQGEPIINETLVVGEDGNLVVIQNQAFHTNNQKWGVRPVVFDGDGKRYLPMRGGAMGGGGGGDYYLSYEAFRLPAKELPVDKVRYVGIEYKTPEGQKAIDSRA